MVAVAMGAITVVAITVVAIVAVTIVAPIVAMVVVVAVDQDRQSYHNERSMIPTPAVVMVVSPRRIIPIVSVGHVGGVHVNRPLDDAHDIAHDYRIGQAADLFERGTGGAILIGVTHFERLAGSAHPFLR